MERVDTITEVETKQLPTGVTLYLIKDSEGTEFSTTERPLARVAQAAVEAKSLVHMEYAKKTNDRGFVKHYLNSIRQLPEDEAPVHPPTLFDDSMPEPPAPVSQAEKDLNIAKAVGLKAAVELIALFPAEEQSASNVQTVAEYFTRWLTTWRP